MKFLPQNKQPKPETLHDHTFIGVFNFGDGYVDVTDPCYDTDTWCAMWERKVKPGVYNAFIDMKNFPSLYRDEDDPLNPDEIKRMDDIRITSLYIQHASYGKRKINGWDIIGGVGVDAGLCGFYSHKPSFDDAEDRLWNGFWRSLSKIEGDNTCDIGKYGVTVSSGYGDGYYPVYARKEGNEIVGLRLRFI